MPSPASTPQWNFNDATNNEFATSAAAYMDLESYFELPPGDNNSSLRENTLATAPSSPILEGIDLWNQTAAGQESPGVPSFNPTLSGGLAALNSGPPPAATLQAGISPLQTTIAPATTFLGHPSPPDSSESSPPAKFEVGGISPLDSLICQLPVEGTRTVHGQVTPPEDMAAPSPVTTINPNFSVGGLTPEHSPPPSRKQSLAEEAEAENNRKRRSSTATSTTRKSRKSSATQDPPDVQEAKRRRFLERNRVAASKCRQKKKAWMADLEAEAREAQARSKQLKHCVSMFREEILQLKTELLKHNTCDCTPIRQYLTNEASKLGSTSAAAKVLEPSPTLQKAEASYAAAMAMGGGSDRFGAVTPEFDLEYAHATADSILNS